MKKIRNLILCAFLCAAPMFTAATCKPTQQRLTYNSLASAGQSVNSAYSAYLDLVVKGSVATNSVPVVSKGYNDFQSAFGAAVAGAQFNLTNPAPQNVVDLMNNVLQLIQHARGQ